MLLTVELHDFTLIAFADGHLMIVSVPDVEGAYPVVDVGSELKSMMMSSVLRTPVAVTVTTDAHDADAIAEVPRVIVPLAIVVVPDPEVPPLAGAIRIGTWQGVDELHVPLVANNAIPTRLLPSTDEHIPAPLSRPLVPIR